MRRSQVFRKAARRMLKWVGCRFPQLNALFFLYSISQSKQTQFSVFVRPTAVAISSIIRQAIPASPLVTRKNLIFLTLNWSHYLYFIYDISVSPFGALNVSDLICEEDDDDGEWVVDPVGFWSIIFILLLRTLTFVCFRSVITPLICFSLISR